MGLGGGQRLLLHSQESGSCRGPSEPKIRPLRDKFYEREGEKGKCRGGILKLSAKREGEGMEGLRVLLRMFQKKLSEGVRKKFHLLFKL